MDGLLEAIFTKAGRHRKRSADDGGDFNTVFD